MHALPTTANAKDLYVSNAGSDGVSYAANDVSNPWRTLDHALANVSGGDTLIIRGGNYAPTVNVHASVSGTQSNPTRITSFTGEGVVIDLANISQAWLDLDGVDYWEISNLEFINAQMVSEVSLTSISNGIAFRNNKITMNRGGDNVGSIRLNANAKGTIIDGNEIIGAGRKADGKSLNSSCLHTDRTSEFQILNNDLSNCVIGFHYKHANSASNSNPGIEYAYNVLHDIDEAMRYNGNHGYIHDNLFIEQGATAIGADNGVPGGNYNTFEHNTFVSGGRLDLSSAGPLGAVQGNIVRNNVFGPTAKVHMAQWSDATHTHDTVLDYNLHPDSGNRIGEHNVWYSLAQWQNYYGGSANSLEGTPVWSGGGNPVTPDDYRLAPSSPGFGAASDGTDMGARFDLFGGSGLTLVRPNPPQALVAN